ncbi:motile sperm domain-containing protein 2-like [Panonychus citri]|uniref:motile sperm domain-containing protein 2-like n=1 Tax=Panonychus citri TaxID=50023 RepID=UPI0023078617|nr:motile sperm domain-containing protein 2-like [Panonychus citri]
MTVIPIHLSYPEETLTQVRSKLREKLSNRLTEIDVNLLDRLMVDDLLLRRYIKRRNGDIETSVPFLCSVLEWRKRMGFPELTETSFPSEFYEVGGIYNYGIDSEGNPVVHIRIRLFQKIEGILDILKKFSIYQMYRADELAASKGPEFGWVLVFDCTDASIANADIDMANFVSSTLRNYFPSGQKYILVHRLPWLLSAVKTLVYTMLPGYVKKKIRFCDEKTLTDHIAINNLPDYLGGPGTPSDYRLIPQGLTTTRELTIKGLLPMSDEQLSKTYQYYDKLKCFLYPNKD